MQNSKSIFYKLKKKITSLIIFDKDHYDHSYEISGISKIYILSKK